MEVKSLVDTHLKEGMGVSKGLPHNVEAELGGNKYRVASKMGPNFIVRKQGNRWVARTEGDRIDLWGDKTLEGICKKIWDDDLPADDAPNGGSF